MAAHADHQAPEPTSGAALLPIFAIATIVGIVVISIVVAAPSTVAVIVALVTVIGFATGIAALLSRLIGPEGH